MEIMNKEKLREHLLKCCPILFFSALTGVFSGIVVVLYSFVAELLSHSSKDLYQKVAENPAFIPLLFLALVILAFLSYVIIKFLPEAKGNGIAANEAHDRALHPLSWWRTIVGTILGSYVSFFGGLSFGVEGPSTAIGTSIGALLSKLYKGKKVSEKDREELKTSVTVSGFSASITSAFNAPITGLVFTIEELEQKFSPYVILAACGSVVTSLFTSTALRSLLGMQERLLNVAINALPFAHSWTLLILGVICGLMAVVFSKSLVLIKEIKFVKKLHPLVKLIIAYLLTGTVGIFLISALGSGTSLLQDVVSSNLSWWMLLVLLLVKIILTLLAMGSDSIGGILLPTLSIGALIGALMGKLFIQLGVPEEYFLTFVIVGSAAFLGATFRTPITAIVLVIEITGSLSGGFAIGIEVLIAFLLAELFNQRPKTKDLF